MITWIEDQLLTLLQRRCAHAPKMVAVDILEGCGGGWEVSYCRRCGAVSPGEEGSDIRAADTHRLIRSWRLPMPNLFRG